MMKKKMMMKKKLGKEVFCGLGSPVKSGNSVKFGKFKSIVGAFK